jgi:hypothetical protein
MTKNKIVARLSSLSDDELAVIAEECVFIMVKRAIEEGCLVSPLEIASKFEVLNKAHMYGVLRRLEELRNG